MEVNDAKQKPSQNPLVAFSFQVLASLKSREKMQSDRNVLDTKAMRSADCETDWQLYVR